MSQQMSAEQLRESVERISADDAFAANETFQANGWTDGLPVIPPTEERVAEFLATTRYRIGDVVGVEAVRMRPITAEKVAINAIMAGCLPSYFPVVSAAVEAMCEEDYLLHGASSSTGGSAPLLIVNGPIRNQIAMNSTANALGNRSRANATIGRAIRLVLINVLEYIPGQLDCATLGHPGKFTLCVAEDEDDSPWVPLAEERGLQNGDSGVTVMASESPHQILNEWTENPEEILETFAAAIRANMLTYSIWSGNYAIVIPKQLRDIIAAAGWQKYDVREYIYASARVRWGDWATVGKAAVADRRSPDEEMCALDSAEALLVVAAGGHAGGFGAVFPPWLGHKSKAVTKRIRSSDEPIGGR